MTTALVSNKDYPSLELVRLERLFLKIQKENYWNTVWLQHSTFIKKEL